MELVDGEDLVCIVIAFPILVSGVESLIPRLSSSQAVPPGMHVPAGSMPQTDLSFEYGAVR